MRATTVLNKLLALQGLWVRDFGLDAEARELHFSVVLRWQVSRLLSHRSFGLHSAEALISLVYLCAAVLSSNPSTHSEGESDLNHRQILLHPDAAAS